MHKLPNLFRTAPVLKLEGVEEICMEKIPGDRRSNHRFQLQLPIQFRLSLKGSMGRSGVATTCDMSTTGLSFRFRKPLPVGAHIEMTVQWPAKYADVHPVDLLATGFVVRSDNGRTGVRVSSRKFRIGLRPQAIAAMA